MLKILVALFALVAFAEGCFLAFVAGGGAYVQLGVSVLVK